MSDVVSINVTPVRDDAELRVWRHRGTGPRLVVCFSGIGDISGEPQPAEFVRSATMNGAGSALFIADVTRSWLNRPGLVERITEIVSAELTAIGGSEIVTLGHSMGAYMAAIMAAPLGAKAAICFSPQVSVNPEITPDEQRWRVFRDKIEEHRITGVHDYMRAETTYYVFFGRHFREAPQRDRFPTGQNVHFYVMPNTVHNTPQRLKKAGVLNRAVKLCAEGRNWRLQTLMKETFNAERLTDPSPAMLAQAAANAARCAGRAPEQSA